MRILIAGVRWLAEKAHYTEPRLSDEACFEVDTDLMKEIFDCSPGACRILPQQASAGHRSEA